ncbi:hypothetical protein C8Q80DRAFT_1124716 [Daedaleopsis nitida]|nr:hypothetical protein C8Q80DRAFT_1124716 [Daedaleopsis nitida]
MLERPMLEELILLLVLGDGSHLVPNGFELEVSEERASGRRVRLTAQAINPEELLHLMQDRPAGQMVRCSKAHAMFAMPHGDDGPTLALPPWATDGTERVNRVIRACQSKIFTVALPRGVVEARDRTLMQQTEHGFAELKFSSGADRMRSSLGLIQVCPWFLCALLLPFSRTTCWEGSAVTADDARPVAIEGIFPYESDPVDEADNWMAHAGARDAHSHIGHDRPAKTHTRTCRTCRVTPRRSLQVSAAGICSHWHEEHPLSKWPAGDAPPPTNGIAHWPSLQRDRRVDARPQVVLHVAHDVLGLPVDTPCATYHNGPQMQKALVVPAAKQPWKLLADWPVLTPGPNEVLVKNISVALNPADWKRRPGAGQAGPGLVRRGRSGAVWRWPGAQAYAPPFVREYPFLGVLDGAGIVEEVGADVTNVAKGDKILYPGDFDQRQATFRLATVLIGIWAHHPSASSVYLPALWEEGGTTKYAGQPPLIIGGSSSVGASRAVRLRLRPAIQVAKLQGFSPILTAAFPAHTVHLHVLGATHAMGGDPLPYAYDAIASEETQTQNVPDDTLAPVERPSKTEKPRVMGQWCALENVSIQIPPLLLARQYRMQVSSRIR